MITSLTTWDSLPPAGGPALLVVNAADGDATSVRAALDALGGWAGRDALHVVAGAGWRDWLEAEGVRTEQALLAQDEQGRDVELAHFLHTEVALPWIAARKFVAVMGVQAHNLYNEEVQVVFEGQLSLLLGDGRLLAHTLPLPYVYLFDIEALVHRFGRHEAVEAYRTRAEQTVEALYEVWVSQGRAPTSDRPDHGDALAPLARHLSPRCMTFEEDTAWPGALVSPVSVRPVVDRLVAAVQLITGRSKQPVPEIHRLILTYLSTLVVERKQAVDLRDRLLAEGLVERNQAVDLRDRLLAEGLVERNQAVELRERLLAEERERYARTLDARVNQGLGKIKRLLRRE